MNLTRTSPKPLSNLSITSLFRSLPRRSFCVRLTLYQESGVVVHAQDSSGVAVLLLEDDPDSLNICRKFLKEEGYQIHVTSSIAHAKELFVSEAFSILFLHVAKIPSQGLEFCEWVRRHSTIPIVMMTDRKELVTEEMAIESGADDYIVRPVTKKLMLMRISQQLGRSGVFDSVGEENVHFHNLTLGLVTHKFTAGKTVIPLTATEFLIMQQFMKQPKRVFTREQILEVIGVGEGPGIDHMLNSHISRLRVKIRKSGAPETIKLIRHMGYKLVDNLELNV